MGPETESPLIITDKEGTLNDYRSRRAECWKVVTGEDYKGDIMKLDIEDTLSADKLEIYLRLFHSEKGAFTRLDTPLADAAEVLTYFQIGRGLKVVYLTGALSGSCGEGIQDTINWLRDNRFPIPDNREVYLYTRKGPQQSDLESKRADMIHILEKGRPIVGIGDKPTDAIVYTENDIPALSFVHPRWEDRKADYPSDTIFVRD